MNFIYQALLGRMVFGGKIQLFTRGLISNGNIFSCQIFASNLKHI